MQSDIEYSWLASPIVITADYRLIIKEYLAIPQEHEKLILSLRTTIANEYSLDKEQTSYDDLLDALTISLKGYRIQ
jgi:hypothetical protein